LRKLFNYTLSSLYLEEGAYIPIEQEVEWAPYPF
jgi:hypothetical protein